MLSSKTELNFLSRLLNRKRFLPFSLFYLFFRDCSNFFFFFPKRFLSWGFKTLFASTSSCQCKPLNFSPAGICRPSLDRRRSSRSDRFRPSCNSGDSLTPTSLTPTSSLTPTFRGSILSTQRIPRGRDLILPTQRIPRGSD